MVQSVTAESRQECNTAAKIQPVNLPTPIGLLQEKGLIGEILRLDWADVWRVPGHIEITAGKSKTRQRRLVEVCPALAAWLEPFRKKTGKVCLITAASVDVIWQQQFLKLCDDAKVSRKRNGLRHAFCTYHFALHANENLTAAQAGNSPAMIHAHYKGLATKAEAEKWFKVLPPKAAKNVIPLRKSSQ